MDEGSLSDTQRTMVLPLLQETNIRGKPYITVSAKGIVNGLSRYPNDGADFGPDTTLGATAPGQYGSPYTETSGVQEAHLYRASLAMQYPTGTSWSFVPPVKILSGTYICNEDIVIYPNHDGVLGTNTTLKFEGQGHNSISQIIFQGNSVYGFDFSGATAGTNIHLENLNLRGGNTNLTSLINAQLPSGGGNYLNLFSVQLAGGTGTLTNGITVSGVGYILGIDFDDEIGNSTTNFLNITGGATGDTWLRIIGLRGAGDIINIASSINSAYIDLKDSMEINVTSTGTVNYMEITGTTRGQIINAGTVNTLNLRAVMLVGNPFVTNSGIINRIKFDGLLTPQTSSGNLISNTGTITWIIYEKSLTVLPNGTYALTYQEPAPTLSANPPVSGTAYQNTNPYDIEIDLPVYATTAGTAGYVTVAKGSTSTPTAIGNQFVNGSTSSTSVDIIKLRVPAGWYYEFTASGVTFGTASVFAD